MQRYADDYFSPIALSLVAAVRTPVSKTTTCFPLAVCNYCNYYP